MSAVFRIRTIVTSATGREIVRETPVAGDTLTIGRDAGNDIVIAELAARPRHARILEVGSGVVIDVGADTLIDGQRRERLETKLAAPVTIGIGSHVVTLAREGETIVATVTRLERPAVDERRAFSLAGRTPGKRGMAWAGLLAIFALFLAWPVWSYFHPRIAATHIAGHTADGSWSAGPLSLAHASLETNCKACHIGAFVAVSDSSCKACHKETHDHADPRRLAAAMPSPGGFDGFKRAVAISFGKIPGRCVDCHQEHLGATTMAKTEQRFCTDCHADLDARLKDSRIGDAGDFAKSHPEFRPLVVTPGGFTRIDFDAHPKEASNLRFPHKLHLSPTGGVARMAQTQGKGLPACADCHTRDPSGPGFRPVSMEKNCESCHSLAFDRVGGTVRRLRHGDAAQAIADLTRAKGGRANAIRILFGRSGACTDCHVVRQPDATGGWRVVPARFTERYLTRGWFDHDAHRVTQCATCHAAKASTKSSDLLIPGIATCRQCHGGNVARPPKVASSCILCHSYHPVSGAPPAIRRRIPNAPLKVAWRN